VSKTLPSDFPNIEISRVRTGRPIRAEDWQTYPPAHNWLWAKSGALWPGIVWDPAFLDTNGNTTNDDTSDGGSPGSANLVFNELIKPYRVLASGNYEFEVSAFLVDFEFSVRIEDVSGGGGTTVTATFTSNNTTGEWVTQTLTLDSEGPWVAYVVSVNQLESSGKVLQIAGRESKIGLTASDIP
jgi:hypothetical protein